VVLRRPLLTRRHGEAARGWWPLSASRYNLELARSLNFYDDNTQSEWTPITGGANLPALNELLAPFGLGFGDAVLRGGLPIGGTSVHLGSAAPLARFPAGGWLVRAPSLHDEAAAALAKASKPERPVVDAAVLGLLQPRAVGAGRIVAFGDTDCVDDVAQDPQNRAELAERDGDREGDGGHCWPMLKAMLEFATTARRDTSFFPDSSRLERACDGGRFDSSGSVHFP
jgi:membrane-bound transcription factor site-1 protease